MRGSRGKLMRRNSYISTPAIGPGQESEEDAIRALYQRMIEEWNARSGEAFAAGYVEDGEAIGFDGSLHTSRAGMASDLQAIFDHHPTARYVSEVTVRPQQRRSASARTLAFSPSGAVSTSLP